MRRRRSKTSFAAGSGQLRRLDQFTPATPWAGPVIIFSMAACASMTIAAVHIHLKNNGKAPEAAKVKLATIDEGRCVQMLHVGPYSEEVKTIEQMMAAAREQGLKVRGPHHEIYLSDPRQVAPEKLPTILRYRVA